MNHDVQNLEAMLCSELSEILKHRPVGALLHIEPYSEFLSSLERFIPGLLSVRFAEWKYESIDGFLDTIAKKIGLNEIVAMGVCILISDQTLTPFSVRLRLTPAWDSLEGYEIRVGEKGGGVLGISGPGCGSEEASKYITILSNRLSGVRWVYRHSSDDL